MIHLWTTPFRLASVLTLCTFPALAMTPTRGTVDYLRTVPSVREFTKPRSFLAKIGTWIAGDADGRTELVRPYATVRDSIGRLLVADPGLPGVHVYDFEKRKYQFIKGRRGQALKSPVGIACDSADNIYVSDSAQARIFVFNSKGSLVRTISGSRPESRPLRPTGIFLDRASNRIYVTDTLRHQVLVYGTDGSFVRAIGKRGTGPGEFNFPTMVTLARGQLHVVDAMNFRIQTLTPEGQFVSAFGRPGNHTGTFNRPKGLALDTDGNFYVADALFDTVQVFDGDGRLLYYFGSSGRSPGQFQAPSGILIDDRNVIYVADSQNHRVQVFRYRKVSE